MHIKTRGYPAAQRRRRRGCLQAALPVLGAMMLTAGAAAGQALAVQPVSVQLPPGQKAATLTVTNRGTNETSIQVRGFVWNQEDGKEQLLPSDEVLVSPPIATIPPGATQLVRMVLRRSPSDREATYRILLDQIPPPAVAGVVRVVLRLSIPIFAQPMTAASAHVQFHIEGDAEQLWLVGVNGGSRHERFRDIVLSTNNGAKLTPEKSASPYILAGATRRWAMTADGGPSPAPGGTLHLSAHGEGGTVEQQISIDRLP